MSPRFAVCSAILAGAGVACGDGMVVDKVYHPYVNAMEQEVEWRTTFQTRQRNRPDNFIVHQFAYGRALDDRWFAELYVIAEESADDALEVNAYEAELLWQVTEQGEYSADYGWLFELETEKGMDAWEFSTGAVVEKEFRNWSATGNLLIAYEWGDDIQAEVDTSLALQARYRYSPRLEPALEFYAGEDTVAAGPVFLGQLTTGPGRRWNWEAGVLWRLDNKSPDLSVRLLLDFEF